MAEKTYLTTTFREKDRVKALGARWDPAAGQWYVPAGLALEPFAAWLPAGEVMVSTPPETASTSRALDPVVKGVPLSRLLAGVGAVVAQAFAESIWVTAEVVRASLNKGHCYLELSERSEDGVVVAQARAVIWSRTAQTLLADFRQATGAELDAGIKVMLRAKPVFKPQFGFSLEVDAIDPSYTLGDLETRKRDIRDRLVREGLFDRNRRLPSPWDCSSVLVVAPERAAGLGDFAKDAQRLQQAGVCQFSYAISRFQGEGAAAEIQRALAHGLGTWSGTTLPDLVVIIRGGGAVNDLAWLNDYALARNVCECPVPVWTGIGHERDSTSVDEVAHRRFDTPSKVIAGIEELVRSRVREARAHHEAILAGVRVATVSVARRLDRQRQLIAHAATTTLSEARTASDAGLAQVRHRSATTLQAARAGSREVFEAVRGEARTQVASARHVVPAALDRIRADAGSGLVHARQRVIGAMGLTLERAVAKHLAAQQLAEQTLQFVADRARGGLSSQADRAEALFREIAGQGPQKTLRRGFAVVRSEGDGRTLTTIKGLAEGSHIRLDLHDGSVGAVVSGQPMPPGEDPATR